MWGHVSDENGRERRRPGRRREILEAFTRQVAERGYDGANFGDLARQLGMSKGTIVHHFGTKDQLLRELHDVYMNRRLAEARVLLDRLHSPEEQLAALIFALVRYQVVDRSSTVAFQREIGRIADDEGYESGRALRDEYRDMVLDVIRRGAAEGSFRAGDHRLWTLQIFGSISWMWTWFEPDGPSDVVAAGAAFVDLALHGLSIRPDAVAGLADRDGPVARLVRECVTESSTAAGVATARPDGAQGERGA